jgi:hypothetical protein
MGNRTRRELKMLVPEKTGREDLMRFARKVAERAFATDRFMIVSINPINSEHEREGEMTYKIEVINLRPN